MTNSLFRRDRQQGIALVVGIIFLLLMTLIGVTAIQTTSLDERMAGNVRDRNLAFQAAEAALRDAEEDIRGIGTRNPAISGISDFSLDCNSDGTAGNDDDGLCDRRPDCNVNDTTCKKNWVASTYSGNAITFPATTLAPPIYAAVTVSMTAAPSIQYGQFTGAASIAELSAQPRYLIEGRKIEDKFYYRITVRAQGASANTVVWLQSVYTP